MASSTVEPFQSLGIGKTALSEQRSTGCAGEFASGEIAIQSPHPTVVAWLLRSDELWYPLSTRAQRYVRDLWGMFTYVLELGIVRLI